MFIVSDLYSKVLSEIEFKVEEEIRKAHTKTLTITSNPLTSRIQPDNTLHVKIPQEGTLPALPSPGQQTNQSLMNCHILSVDMFNKEQLNDIFNLAQTLRVFVIKQRPLDHILRVNGVTCYQMRRYLYPVY